MEGRLGRASTEPRSFERGDMHSSFYQSPTISASTEPRSFERGDDWGSARAIAAIELQRSRALSSAEMLLLWRAGQDESTLQRSRALSSAEMHPAWKAWALSDRFNGAALFRARRSQDQEPREHMRQGFNGAALFRARRYPPRAQRGARPLRASTEPRSFERGDRWMTSSSALSGSRFNGAALFRARR